MRPEDFIIDGPGQFARRDCESLLRSLPEWFGIEAALRRYATDADALPTFTARCAGNTLGFLTGKHHFERSAEVHVMAVRRELHRRGIGTALLVAAETWLRRHGVRLLGVKTVSASSTDPHYARTRQFYLDRGFEPLEEMPTVWGEGNPCLLMVKCRTRDLPHNPPLERTAAAVYFTSSQASHVRCHGRSTASRYPAMANPNKKPFRLNPDQIRPIATGYGGCIATDMITCGGRKVGFMYREATEREPDSGWRFMSGYESDEYMNDGDNHAVYDVNTIANYDSDIIPFLDAPVGSAFKRENGTGPFVEVHDFEPPAD